MRNTTKANTETHYNWGMNDALADMRSGNTRRLYTVSDARIAIAHNTLPLFAVNELIDADYFAGYRDTIRANKKA